MENGEAICCFGEAIAFYDYSVSSGPFFFRFEIVIGPGPGPGPELDNLKKRKFQGKTLRKDSTDEGIKHKCDVCGLYVKTRKYLVKHRSKKHGLKTKRENNYNKYQSVEVEKVAVVKEEVVDEVGIEDIKTKVKNQCETCLRSFSKKDKLKRHMFIHLPDSEKPHKCHYCNKGFTQKAQLTVHLERHHNIENLEVKVKKTVM